MWKKNVLASFFFREQVCIFVHMCTRAHTKKPLKTHKSSRALEPPGWAFSPQAFTLTLSWVPHCFFHSSFFLKGSKWLLNVAIMTKFPGCITLGSWSLALFVVKLPRPNHPNCKSTEANRVGSQGWWSPCLEAKSLRRTMCDIKNNIHSSRTNCFCSDEVL